MKYKFLLSILLISMLTITACGNTTATVVKINDTVTESTENLSTETEQTITTEQTTDSETTTEEATQTETNSQTTEQPPTSESTENTETPVQQEIRVKELNQTMYAKQSVNVRKGDSTDYEKIGALSFNQQVQVTGQSEATGWYRIEFNGETGFVSSNYLSTEKTVVTTPPPTTNTDNNNNNSSNDQKPQNNNEGSNGGESLPPSDEGNGFDESDGITEDPNAVPDAFNDEDHIDIEDLMDNELGEVPEGFEWGN